MIRVGGNCSISISVDYLQGEFDEPIVLSVDDLPAGITAEFSYPDERGIVPGTGGSLDLAFRGIAAAGPIELTVTGTTAAHGSDSFVIPVTVTSNPGFPLESVAVGHNVACGIDAAGQAFCWGDNTQGTLGIGNAGISGGEYKRIQPSAVVGGVSFSKIASGGSKTCGLDTSGSAYCWGAGYLGDGEVPLEPRSSPGPVAGGLTFIDIVVGGSLACGLTAAGEVYCWGGANGGLGNGTFDAAQTPMNIGAGHTYVAIAAASSATCALADEGTAYCWGDNTYEQLGTTSMSLALSPVAVSSSVKLKAIAMSFDSTCGLSEDGVAYCWGGNSSGNLGLGAPDSESHPTPAPVAGDLVFSAIAGGGGGFCGLDAEGKAYCWGFAGTEDHMAVVAPTPVSGELLFSQISVGAFTNCGIASNSPAVTYCWRHGSGNYDGYLGTGDTEDYAGPVAIAAP